MGGMSEVSEETGPLVADVETQASGDARGTMRQNRVALVVGAIVALLLAGALAYHLAAASVYCASFDTGLALEARAAAAARAARMEPWNATFATRDDVMSGWVRGRDLLQSGNFNAAVDILALAYRNDIGDAQLLALFRQAQDLQSLNTVIKAHLQHGLEGPGGTLKPSDVQR